MCRLPWLREHFEESMDVMMKIFVRAFEERDRGALRLLYKASRDAAFFWSEEGAHQVTDFDKHTESEIILVAQWRGEIVGFASIWEPDSFLHNLFVHPSFLRRGVGRALVQRCSEHFHSMPTLKCVKANAGAMLLYQANGWITLREEAGPDGPYVLMANMALFRPTS